MRQRMPDAASRKHVTQLADRRVGQHPLDVPLHQAMVAANSAVATPMTATMVMVSGARLNRELHRATI